LKKKKKEGRGGVNVCWQNVAFKFLGGGGGKKKCQMGENYYTKTWRREKGEPVTFEVKES